jgi:hypothetical protein
MHCSYRNKKTRWNQMQLTQGKTHSNLEKDNADNFGYKEILSNESIQQTIVDKKSMCYISFTKYKQM